MEKIKINKLDQRGNMLIVGHDKGEHTLNTAWQNTEVEFLKSVGVGGEVNVELITKPNPKDISKVYHNIKTVDMTDFTKGVTMPPAMTQEQATTVTNKLPSLRDEKIIAQVILKEANNHINAHIAAGLEMDDSKYGEWLCTNVNELCGAYKVALSNISNEL